MSYGRVAFYMQHCYRGRIHSFAMVRWYDPVDQAGKSSTQAVSQQEAMEKRFADLHTNAYVRASFTTFPIITTAFTTGTDVVHDMIPVHRITSRWMPVVIPGDPKHQFACRLPTRTH